MVRRDAIEPQDAGRREFLKGIGAAGALGGAATILGAPLLSSPAEAAVVTYQAEDARIHRGTREASHPGFSGSGFVNTRNEVGSYVEWTVSVPRSRTATLIFRYANGATQDRPMAIRVNGTTVASRLSMPPTGAWPAWATRSMTASLRAGTNVIRATATTSAGGPNLDLLDVNDGTDWGVAVVESTMKRRPRPEDVGAWNYFRAFYLRGQHRVYLRTRDPRHLQYIRAWVDSHVDLAGNIDKTLAPLDDIEPGNLLLLLHRETGLNKYKVAADKVKAALDAHPRTSEGVFWHGPKLEGQIWLDGTYVALPFLIRYAQAYGGLAKAQDDAANQLLVHARRLRHPTYGLLYHAHDEQGDPAWADPRTHRSPELWGRAIGWYGMALIDVLDMLPADHPRRKELLAVLASLVAGLARFQDPATGRWFQVVDKGNAPGNWLETSSSSMFTYLVSHAIDRGYVPMTYAPVVRKGFPGVLAEASMGTDGLATLRNTSQWAVVGDLSYYLDRGRLSNELHGLGAFLMMYEEYRARAWR